MAPGATTLVQSQQHVVAVPVHGQGHLNPLMRFCKLLASHHGVLVTFVNIDPVHHRMQELLDDLVAPAEESPSLNLRRASIPVEGIDLTADFRVPLQRLFGALNSIAPHLELLIHKLNQSGPSVTCIVSDIVMTLPTQNVAEKLDIPRIVFIPHSASSLLLYYHIIQGETISKTKALEALTRRAEGQEIVSDRLTGLPPIYNQDLPWYKHVDGDDNAYMWEFTTKVYEESFNRARAVVINSSEDLEASALMALSKHLSLPVYGVGPLVEPLQRESSTSLWKEDKACILWLDQQPPLSVLYISFGSVSIVSQVQIEEMIAGLVASRQCFLWAFRPDLVENVESYTAFISDIRSRSDGRGYVVNWAPQLRVLSHPSVGGFLTHCGWNSCIEAIVHGVPMLCWPYFADQFLNAKYVVEEWKVGLKLEARSEAEGAGCLVGRGEVERAIKAVMEGEGGSAMRKNARGLKEAVCGSFLTAGSTPDNDNKIEALLGSLM